MFTVPVNFLSTVPVTVKCVADSRITETVYDFTIKKLINEWIEVINTIDGLLLHNMLMLMFIHLRLKVRHGKFVTRLYIH